MKKLLTLTSILAAGTLCANAGTAYTLTLTDLSSNTSGTGWTYSASSGAVTTTDAFGYYTLDKVVRYSATTLINLDLTSLGVTSKTSTGTSGIQLIDYRNSSNTTATSTAIGLITTSSGISMSYEDAATGDTYSWADLYSASYSANGRNYVMIALQGCAVTTTETSGDFSAGSTVYLVDSAMTSSTAIIPQNTDLKSTQAKYNQICLDTDYITGAWIYTAAGSSSKIVSAASSLKIIPEPSLFGLLAGTLALALAGTRRRRRAK